MKKQNDEKNDILEEIEACAHLTQPVSYMLFTVRRMLQLARLASTEQEPYPSYTEQEPYPSYRSLLNAASTILESEDEVPFEIAQRGELMEQIARGFSDDIRNAINTLTTLIAQTEEVAADYEAEKEAENE